MHKHIESHDNGSTTSRDLERFLNSRFNTARGLLATDADAAEEIFIELLHEPQLAHWMRVQCNIIFACIADDVEVAAIYLLDARDVLAYFKEGRTHLQPDPLQTDIAQMEEGFEEVEQEIAYWRVHPWDEPEGEEEVASKDIESEQQSSLDDDDVMLPRYQGDPSENELTAGIDEIFSGDHGDPETTVHAESSDEEEKR